MMQSIDLTKALKYYMERYEVYINRFNEEIIEKYSLNLSPLIASRKQIIPRQGFIDIKDERVDYFFHGNGCSMHIGKIIVEFDYERTHSILDDIDWSYRKFNLYQLWIFITSYPDSDIRFMEKEVYSQNIKILEEERYIRKINNNDQYSDWIKC